MNDERIVVNVFDSRKLAQRTAAHIEECLRHALSERGSATLAVSGGRTPQPMFVDLFASGIDWQNVAILQVDERLAPAGHEDRNLTGLQDCLIDTPALQAELLSMPVENDDSSSAAAAYTETLFSAAGAPPVLDVIQLGIGADGHTASLIPDDPVLTADDDQVRITGEYQGRRRMTLTFPTINRSRSIVWMVSGESKQSALQGMLTGDRSLPASSVRRDAVVFADSAAAGP